MLMALKLLREKCLATISSGEIHLDKAAEIEVAIETDNGDLLPLNKRMTLELVNNQGIFFEFTGDSIEEATIIGIK